MRKGDNFKQSRSLANGKAETQKRGIIESDRCDTSQNTIEPVINLMYNLDYDELLNLTPSVEGNLSWRTPTYHNVGCLCCCRGGTRHETPRQGCATPQNPLLTSSLIPIESKSAALRENYEASQ